jgi:predicted RNA binding protein YcfA (HicA-like mRNA interferase family)
MPPKVRAVIRRLEREGWRLADQEGSHRQFKHPKKPGKVTVAGHLNEEMAPGHGTMSSGTQDGRVENDHEVHCGLGEDDPQLVCLRT